MDCELTEKEISNVRQIIGTAGNHVDTLADVARGKRWFVTDAVCAAASYVLHRTNDLAKEVRRLVKEAEDGRHLIKDATTSVAEAKKVVQKVTKERDAVQVECSNLREHAIEADKNAAALTRKVDEVTCAIQATKKDLAEAKGALTAMHGRIADMDKRASVAESRANALQERLHVAECSLATFVDGKAKMLDLINNLKVAVEEME